MNDEAVKVLYIAGWGRSGSTILDNILGQVEGFFTTGELRYLWERGLVENRLCSCGLSFQECGVWKKVLDTAFSPNGRIDTEEMLRLDQRARTRHIPLLLAPAGRRHLARQMKPYLDTLARLYRAIQSTTGARVIVDSSKYPSYARVLGMLPGIDLYVIHLIRDARAVAFSWMRSKPQLDTRDLIDIPRFHPVKSSILWSGMNTATEVALGPRPGRYLRLRYEDFVTNPQESVARIVDFVGEPASRLPFVTGNEVEIGPSHTVAGNPVRFRSGVVTLRSDQEWRSRMKVLDKLVVTALTWPLLMRYGYVGGHS